MRAVVVERAEGNPFFVEELVRTLVDQGVLQRRNGGWTVGELPAELDVPDTVQAVLASRIDLLGPAEKSALQAAAVIGRTFWSGPVYELVEGAEPDLRVLEERDFIHRRTSSSLVGEREFAIKHTLTREVAYSSLPKTRRARLHARFAGWLERAGEGRDEQRRSWRTTTPRPCGPRTPTSCGPGSRARRRRCADAPSLWLRRAADLAVGRYEIDDAVSLLRARGRPRGEPAGTGRDLARDRPCERAVLQRRGVLDRHAAGDRARRDDDAAADLHAELAFQTLVRAGMWGVAPPAELVDGWIARALELARPDSAARAKALIARCYGDYDKSARARRRGRRDRGAAR